MTLAELAELTRRLAGTGSRLEKVALVAAFLRRLEPAEVPWAVAFLAGRPLPASDPRTLGVSWATLQGLAAVAPESAGPAPGAAGSEPPGFPAPGEPPRPEDRQPAEVSPSGAGSLTLADVARTFVAVAEAGGRGARAAKARELRALFAAAGPEERRLLLAVLLGEMRTGVQDGLMQEALARAAGVSPESVRRASLFVSDLSEVARIALVEGEAGLRATGVRLFVPLLPMLAEPAADLGEVLAAHGGRTALEAKYDGARIQLHREGDTVRIWSRRLTEVTGSLPEVAALARRDLGARAAILDGEVLAVGAEGRPLPFQDLMRRFRRVRGVEAAAREVPVRLYLFDCLYLDGRELVDRPYAERWERLAALTGGRHLAERLVTGDRTEAEAFLRRCLEAGHEGVLAKALDSPYTPGVRGRRWFKVKPADTLDCVIVAADRGSGRRRGWLSNYHLAVRDEAGGLAEVGKTFKGLTDAEFRAMTARLWSLALADDGYTVRVRPEVVVEVAYNEIQRSPRYPSGFALRFARITRVRDDKRPEDADTLTALRARFARQGEGRGRGGW